MKNSQKWQEQKWQDIDRRVRSAIYDFDIKRATEVQMRELARFICISMFEIESMLDNEVRIVYDTPLLKKLDNSSCLRREEFIRIFREEFFYQFPRERELDWFDKKPAPRVPGCEKTYNFPRYLYLERVIK